MEIEFRLFGYYLTIAILEPIEGNPHDFGYEVFSFFIAPPDTTPVRGPARDIHRRVSWQKHLPRKQTLAEFIKPMVANKRSTSFIIGVVRSNLKGRPLADEKELDKRIAQTVRSERSKA